MTFRLLFYNDAVEVELDAWPVGLRARFRALTLRMEEYGPNLGMPHTRALSSKFAPKQRKESEERFSAPWSDEDNSSQFHQKDGQDTKTGTRYSAYPAEGGH